MECNAGRNWIEANEHISNVISKYTYTCTYAYAYVYINIYVHLYLHYTHNCTCTQKTSDVASDSLRGATPYARSIIIFAKADFRALPCGWW